MSDTIEVAIEYPGWTDNLASVSQVSEGLYRLEFDPLSSMLAESEEAIEALPEYGDVIEAEMIAAHTLKFIRVVQRAKLKRFEFIVPEQGAASTELAAILSKVERHHGHWERVFGGVVLIFLPQDAGYDPSDDIQNLEPKIETISIQ